MFSSLPEKSKFSFIDLVFFLNSLSHFQTTCETRVKLTLSMSENAVFHLKVGSLIVRKLSWDLGREKGCGIKEGGFEDRLINDNKFNVNKSPCKVRTIVLVSCYFSITLNFSQKI